MDEKTIWRGISTPCQLCQQWLVVVMYNDFLKGDLIHHWFTKICIFTEFYSRIILFFNIWTRLKHYNKSSLACCRHRRSSPTFLDPPWFISAQKNEKEGRKKKEKRKKEDLACLWVCASLGMMLPLFLLSSKGTNLNLNGSKDKGTQRPLESSLHCRCLN